MLQIMLNLFVRSPGQAVNPRRLSLRRSRVVARFSALALCCLATGLVSASPADKMTYEEEVVRNTYAKLAYAVQVGTVHRAVKEDQQLTAATLDARLAAGELRFEFTNFAVGNLADARGNYSDLVAKPSGSDALAVTTVAFSFKEGLKETVETHAEARWITEQTLLGEDWNIPAAKAFMQIEHANWYSRYAAYTATVSFEGRSRTYNAVFLFGKNDKGEDEVLPLDTVTGNSALHDLWKASVYPATLLETKWRGHQAVTHWLKSNQVSDRGCQAGKHEVCCNATTLKCGVAAEDVRSALGEPIAKVVGPRFEGIRPRCRRPDDQRPGGLGISEMLAGSASAYLATCDSWNKDYLSYAGTDEGTDYHVIGSHTWQPVTFGSCRYTGDPGVCDATADAGADASMLDSGITINSCHVPRYNKAGGHADGIAPSATSVVAGAVKSCFLCGCFFEITVGPISFPPDSFFQRQQSYTVTCQGHNSSPIIIDTTGGGFHLTSVENGSYLIFAVIGYL